MEGLEKLEADLKVTMERKEELEANAKLCEERMGRAFRLVGGLADERERWIQTISTIEGYKKDVVGDILICAGSQICEIK